MADDAGEKMLTELIDKSTALADGLRGSPQFEALVAHHDNVASALRRQAREIERLKANARKMIVAAFVAGEASANGPDTALYGIEAGEAFAALSLNSVETREMKR